MFTEVLFDKYDLISQSWKRCQDFGLSPTDPLEDSFITGRALRNLMKENEPFITHASSAINTLFPSYYSGLVITIVDRNGTIIHRVGQLDTTSSGDVLSIGSNWSEENKGTNAMGLAIFAKEPIITHADHHFYVKHQFLTCAASPVYSPTGELLGAVNISARKELYHPFLFSLTNIMANFIQNGLLLDKAKNEKVLTIKELEATANLVTVPLLSLDDDKRIIRANQSARQLLGEDCLGKEFHNTKGYATEVVSDPSRKQYRSVLALQKPSNKTSTQPRLYTITDIVGSCPKMNDIRRIVKKAALTDFPMIIYGESGTGKELIAQSLHTSGQRGDKPFIAVNCSAIPEGLIESELFGYEKGAFTGANREGVIGKFEAANGGTLFLDEIGDMSLKAQAVLLRVLQEKSVTRVGGIKPIPINTRVIAATHKNLRKEIEAGRFREDLYYRLKGVVMTLPPLRERSDLIELSQYLMKKLDYPSLYLSKEAKDKLLSYHWPGNVRELNSVLMQASFLAEGNEMKAEDLDFEIEYEQDQPSQQEEKGPPTSLINSEKEVIRKTLDYVSWNISKAATILKISRNTLYLKIKKYHLQQ
jgi:sigma-54 dependent transcriptional regulator, acetoin dehydrogenase operon transcriptional activator AcoR